MFGKKNIDILSDNEYADGWMVKLPKRKKSSEIKTLDISLNELPLHLFPKIDIYNLNEKVIIKDHIYTYVINKSDHDNIIYQLYEELFIKKSNNITDLLKYCNDNNINGSLIKYAEKYSD